MGKPTFGLVVFVVIVTPLAFVYGGCDGFGLGGMLGGARGEPEGAPVSAAAKPSEAPTPFERPRPGVARVTLGQQGCEGGGESVPCATFVEQLRGAEDIELVVISVDPQAYLEDVEELKEAIGESGVAVEVVAR
jgi:hypothetical protein